MKKASKILLILGGVFGILTAVVLFIGMLAIGAIGIIELLYINIRLLISIINYGQISFDIILGPSITKFFLIVVVLIWIVLLAIASLLMLLTGIFALVGTKGKKPLCIVSMVFGVLAFGPVLFFLPSEVISLIYCVVFLIIVVFWCWFPPITYMIVMVVLLAFGLLTALLTITGGTLGLVGAIIEGKKAKEQPEELPVEEAAEVVEEQPQAE